MANEPLAQEQPALTGTPRIGALTLAVWVVLFALVALAAYWLGTQRTANPAAGSAEVGFARDMMQHHAQAVDMAVLLRDRTGDVDLRQIALDMALTQQAQIGQMQGWLRVWGYPLARTGPAMEWMGMPTTGPMPGMASPEDLNRLRGLQGAEAEVLFLQLMIPHHRAGVAMAEAALERAREPAVRDMAQSIVDAQQSEVDLMQELLQQRGQPPVPERDTVHEETGDH